MSLALVVVGLTSVAVSNSATDALKARDAEIRANLPPPGADVTPAIRTKLQDILTRAVDFEEMAKSSLGKHWDAQTPAKRKKFMQAFVARFKRASTEQIESYRSSKTEFGAEEPLDDQVRVATKLVVKGEPTNVIYVMRKAGKTWRIVDIVIDDVSTVQNYRSSFAKIINKDGFDALIARLSRPG